MADDPHSAREVTPVQEQDGNIRAPALGSDLVDEARKANDRGAGLEFSGIKHNEAVLLRDAAARQEAAAENCKERKAALAQAEAELVEALRVEAETSNAADKAARTDAAAAKEAGERIIARNSAAAALCAAEKKLWQAQVQVARIEAAVPILEAELVARARAIEGASADVHNARANTDAVAAAIERTEGRIAAGVAELAREDLDKEVRVAAAAKLEADRTLLLKQRCTHAVARAAEALHLAAEAQARGEEAVRVEETNAAAAAIETARNELALQRKQVEAEIRRVQDAISAAEQRQQDTLASELRQELAILEQRLADLLAELQRLEAQLAALELVLQQLQAQLAALMLLLQQLIGALQAARAAEAAQLAVVQKLQQSYEAAVAAEAQALRAHNESLAALAKAQRELLVSQKQLAAAKALLAQHQMELQQAEAELAQAHADLARLRQQEQELEMKAAMFAAMSFFSSPWAAFALVATFAQLITVRNSRNRAETRVQSLEGKVDAARCRVADSTTKVKDAEENVTQRTATLEQATAAEKVASGTLVDAKTATVAAHTALDQGTALLNELAAATAAAEARHDAARLSFSELEARVATAQADVDTVRGARDAAADALKQSNAIVTDADIEVVRAMKEQREAEIAHCVAAVNCAEAAGAAAVIRSNTGFMRDMAAEANVRVVHADTDVAAVAELQTSQHWKILQDKAASATKDVQVPARIGRFSKAPSNVLQRVKDQVKAASAAPGLSAADAAHTAYENLRAELLNPHVRVPSDTLPTRNYTHLSRFVDRDIDVDA